MSFNPNPSPLVDEVMRDRFLQLERAGCPSWRIAAELGVSVRTLSRWRRSLGLPRVAPPVVRPVEDRERARLLLEDGCSLAEAARTVGVAEKTVRRWFPDAEPWSKSQCAEYLVQCRRLAAVA